MDVYVKHLIAVVIDNIVCISIIWIYLNDRRVDWIDHLIKQLQPKSNLLQIMISSRVFPSAYSLSLLETNNKGLSDNNISAVAC